MKKNTYILYFLILSVLNSFSQDITQNITGRILDNVSNEPLPNANIILKNSSPPVGTVSNENGQFILKDIPVGTISLRISYLGYRSLDLDNLTLKPGKEMVITARLEEMAFSGKEIVITVKTDKSKTRNTMTTVSSRGFTVEETQRYAGSRNDVARMASNFAGVQVESDARNDIIIRGNSPSGLLWKLEGVDIPNPNHYGAFGTTGGPVSILNNNHLDNSDFLTGAFPSEFGNALSGVFDLTMRNGNTNKYEFLGQIGFNGFEFGAEGPLFKGKSSSFMVNYRLSTLEVFKALGVDFGTGVAVPKYQDFTYKFSLPSTKAGKFTFFGIGGKSQIKLENEASDTSQQNMFFGKGYNVINMADQIVMGMNHIFQVNEKSYTRLNLAYTYHDFITKTDSVDPISNKLIPDYRNFFKENKIHVSFFFKQKVNPRNNFKIGISGNFYFHEFIDSVFEEDYNQFITLTNYLGESSLFQPYFSWQFKPAENFLINMGLHYQYYTFNSSSSLEPRLGIRWSFGAGNSISFGYGLHSQILPVTIYNKETFISPGQYMTNNKDLKMLKSHHLILSYDYRFTEFLRFKTELYYQHIFDAAICSGLKNSYSILNQGADFYIPAPDSLISNGTGNNYGIEFTMERFLNKGMYLLGTLSLFESKYTGSDGVYRNTAFNGNFIANLLFGKEFELSKGKSNKKKKHYLGFDIKINWTGGHRHSPIDTTRVQHHGLPSYIESEAFELQYPNYFRTDLKVLLKSFGRKSNIEFIIDIQNLFDTQNIYNETYNKETQEVYYNYQMGRLIIPQFKIEF